MGSHFRLRGHLPRAPNHASLNPIMCQALFQVLGITWSANGPGPNEIGGHHNSSCLERNALGPLTEGKAENQSPFQASQNPPAQRCLGFHGWSLTSCSAGLSTEPGPQRDVLLATLMSSSGQATIIHSVREPLSPTNRCPPLLWAFNEIRPSPDKRMLLPCKIFRRENRDSAKSSCGTSPCMPPTFLR